MGTCVREQFTIYVACGPYIPALDFHPGNRKFLSCMFVQIEVRNDGLRTKFKIEGVIVNTRWVSHGIMGAICMGICVGFYMGGYVGYFYGATRLIWLFIGWKRQLQADRQGYVEATPHWYEWPSARVVCVCWSGGDLTLCPHTSPLSDRTFGMGQQQGLTTTTWLQACLMIWTDPEAPRV